MLCTGDMYLSSLFVCRRPSCQTTPHGVWDALRYVQVLFQFCAWQGHLDSVPGAVEGPGMIYLTHHGVIEIPLVRLLPINSNVRCFAHYTFSLLFSMDTPIPHFLFLDLYSYSLYPFIIFSLFFFFRSSPISRMYWRQCPCSSNTCTSLERAFLFLFSCPRPVHCCRWQGVHTNCVVYSV